ncbi:hypothetical protein D9M72_424910 [compost metagenome]
MLVRREILRHRENFGLSRPEREAGADLRDQALEQGRWHRRHGVQAQPQVREIALRAQGVLQQRGIHQREPEHQRDAFGVQRVEQRDRIEAALDDQSRARHQRGRRGAELSAVEQRHQAGKDVRRADGECCNAGRYCRQHGAVRMHRALGPPGGAAGVHDERQVTVFDQHRRRGIGHARQHFGERGNAGHGRGCHCQPHRQAETLQRRLQGAVQMAVHYHQPCFSVFHDVPDVLGRQHRIDRHPDHARLQDAIRGHEEGDGVDAHHRHLIARLQAAGQQMMGEAVAVGFECGIAHALLCVHQRDLVTKAARAPVRGVAERVAVQQVGLESDIWHGF